MNSPNFVTPVIRASNITPTLLSKYDAIYLSFASRSAAIARLSVFDMCSAVSFRRDISLFVDPSSPKSNAFMSARCTIKSEYLRIGEVKWV